MQQIITIIDSVLPYIETRFPVRKQAAIRLDKRDLRQLELRKKHLNNKKFNYCTIYNIYNHTVLLTL